MREDRPGDVEAVAQRLVEDKDVDIVGDLDDVVSCSGEVFAGFEAGGCVSVFLSLLDGVRREEGVECFLMRDFPCEVGAVEWRAWV